MEIVKIYKGEWDFFKDRVLKIFVFCCLLFAIVLVVNYQVFIRDAGLSKEVFSLVQEAFAAKGLFGEMGNIDLYFAIFTNNLIAAFIAMTIGIIPFLFLPFFAIISNAVIIAGVVAAEQIIYGHGLGGIFVSLIPHGIFELPAFFYAVSLGVYCCLAITNRITGSSQRIRAIFLARRMVRNFIFVVVPLLALAAFMEVFVAFAFME